MLGGGACSKGLPGGVGWCCVCRVVLHGLARRCFCSFYPRSCLVVLPGGVNAWVCCLIVLPSIALAWRCCRAVLVTGDVAALHRCAARSGSCLVVPPASASESCFMSDAACGTVSCCRGLEVCAPGWRGLASMKRVYIICTSGGIARWYICLAMLPHAAWWRCSVFAACCEVARTPSPLQHLRACRKPSVSKAAGAC